MRGLFIAVLALGLAGSASAQTTNTNCYWIGTQMYCTSQQQQPPNYHAVDPMTAYQRSYMFQRRAFEDGQRMRAAREAQRQQQEQAFEAQRAAQGRQMVADAVREGSCDEAKDRALGLGDLDMAEQVTRICVPK